MFNFHPEVTVFTFRSVARFKSETSFFIKNVEPTRKHYRMVNVFKGNRSLNVFIFILLKTNTRVAYLKICVQLLNLILLGKWFTTTVCITLLLRELKKWSARFFLICFRTEKQYNLLLIVKIHFFNKRFNDWNLSLHNKSC